MAITICLENPGDGDDHLIDSARTGAVVIRQIGSAHVRLNYDIGNVFINTRGARRPEEDLAEAIPCSAHFHLKDIRADPTGYCLLCHRRRSDRLPSDPPHLGSPGAGRARWD